MREKSRLTDFLVARALPLWASAGYDEDAGSFVERLDASGRPDLDAAKRVRVQARQIYVYAHAATLGIWPAGRDLAMRAFEFLDRNARATDRAGFVHSTARYGQPLDTRCDSYDHAFLLFAFSWLFRATGAPDVRRAMDTVLSVIETHLTLDEGGVAVDTNGGQERQQNPNMHLFEALLAAADATGDDRFLGRADAQYALFRHHLFDEASGVIREYYGPGWAPAPGMRGEIVEPGHQCEWLWLLKRHADAHRRPVGHESLRLAEFVRRFGRPGGGTLVCDQVTVEGHPLKTSTRLWPQTEAIKAEIALAEIAGTPLSQQADAVIDALFETFLDQPIPGAWIDWIDETGKSIVPTVPASSLYHLFLCFSEYLVVPSQ